MSVVRDLRIAVRHLLRAPIFALTAILMLALGISASTAIFSIVEAVLLRPLPFPESNRLVVLSDIVQGASVAGNGEAGVTAPDIRNYTRDTHSFTSLGGYSFTAFELSGGANPDQLNASRLSAGVFPALAVQPILGRVFSQQEDEQHQQVTVLSYSTWQSRFNADPGVVGRKILLDRKPYVVIGVMPRNFEFPLVPGHLNRSELWVPMSFLPEELGTGAASWSFQMVGRLRPGVTADQAQSDAAAVARETVRSYPAFMAGFSMHPVVRLLHEETVEQARPLVRTLFFAVSVVLLIACANLAGLLLVRAIRRRREIAVRLALGATAATLLRQAVLESLVLSIIGGALGLVLAVAAMRVGVSLLPETLPRVNEIGLDWQVVAFAFGLAIFTGVVCGLAPAFAAIRTSVNDTLKEGGRTGTAGSGHGRLRSALVIAEVAVALMLLTASGLLLRSFEKMREVDLGFQPDHTLVAEYGLPTQQYATQSSIGQFNQELLRRLQQQPGVRSAGLTTFLPASGYNNSGVFVAEGYVPQKGEGLSLATPVNVQGDYFSAMGIPLLHGRFFTLSDKAGAPLVVIVNHNLATHSWPGQNPVGKRFRIGMENMQTPWATVVGEVADIRESSPDRPTKQEFYSPIDQLHSLAGSLASPADIFGNSVYLAVRTARPPGEMVNTLRATVHGMDAQLPLNQAETMEHAISDSEAPRRFNTALITSFAVAAVLLAVLGIYSVIAFSVALRVQEIAIRMALGSQRSGIVSLILMTGARLALIGCAIGLVGAVAASQLMRSFVFGISVFDPLVLTFAALFILVLALAACLLPARRASSINPMRALRAD
jgi:putative ABC transport system permease protein